MKYSDFFVSKWYFVVPLAMVALANAAKNPVGCAAAVCSLLLLMPWAYNSYAPYLLKAWPKIPSWIVPTVLLVSALTIASSTPEFEQMQKARFVQDSIRAAKRAQEKAVEQTEETRVTKTVDPYEKHFSGWDGSCYPLVKYIKASLNDPSSFNHEQTLRGLPDNGSMQVKMTFRAKNGFGALVVKTATCQLWADGTVTGVKVE